MGLLPFRLQTLRADLSIPVAFFKNARHKASHLRQSVFDYQGSGDFAMTICELSVNKS